MTREGAGLDSAGKVSAEGLQRLDSSCRRETRSSLKQPNGVASWVALTLFLSFATKEPFYPKHKVQRDEARKAVFWCDKGIVSYFSGETTSQSSALPKQGSLRIGYRILCSDWLIRS